MSTSISITCYKYKTLSNGECPLMIRVNQNGARKYKSTGISILPQYWDFKKNIPKSNCPNKEVIEKLIINKLKTFNDKIIELKAEDKSFTAQSLIDKVNNPTKIQTVGELFKQKIEIFKNENRIAYSQSFLQTYNSLIEYNKHLALYFSDLNELWVRKYESYLKGKYNGRATCLQEEEDKETYTPSPAPQSNGDYK